MLLLTRSEHEDGTKEPCCGQAELRAQEEEQFQAGTLGSNPGTSRIYIPQNSAQVEHPIPRMPFLDLPRIWEALLHLDWGTLEVVLHVKYCPQKLIKI